MNRSLCLAALLVLGLGACRGAPRAADEPPYPLLQAAELGSMHNVSRSGEVWFGGAPREADLDLAARRGVRRVIDLSTPDEPMECDVAGVSGRLGLAYVAVGRGGEDLYGDAAVDLVLGQLELGEPALLFCGNGSRCAVFVTIHRVLRHRVPLEQALVDARRAGMKPGIPEAFVRAQVQRLAVPAG